MLAGIPQADPSRVAMVTVTAPGLDLLGSGPDVLAWNDGAGQRVCRLAEELRRESKRLRAPRPEYAVVPELQKRGAVHFHGFVRDCGWLTADVLRDLAVRVGFGSRVQCEPVRKRFGAARYMAGYVVKARDEFPLGTRYVRTSQGWPLETAARSPTSGTPYLAGPPRGVSWESLLSEDADYWMAVARDRGQKAKRRRESRADYEAHVLALYEARAAERGWS